MDDDGGGSATPMAASGSRGGNASGSGNGAARRSGEEDGEDEEASAKAAKPARSRWAAMDDSSEDEGGAAAARKRKKLGGAGGSSGGLGVDDWRELLASGKQALAGKTPGSAPRGILSRGSGGSNGNGSGRASAGKKRVRWPDEVRAVVVHALCWSGRCSSLDGTLLHCTSRCEMQVACITGDCIDCSLLFPCVQAAGAGEEEEQGFRIGGGGERAKAGLEVGGPS